MFQNKNHYDAIIIGGGLSGLTAASLLANAECRVVYRQETDQIGAAAQALGLTGTEQSLLPGLGIGQALWRIKERAFLIQHQLHPEELRMFDTRGRLTT